MAGEPGQKAWQNKTRNCGRVRRREKWLEGRSESAAGEDLHSKTVLHARSLSRPAHGTPLPLKTEDSALRKLSSVFRLLLIIAYRFAHWTIIHALLPRSAQFTVSWVAVALHSERNVVVLLSATMVWQLRRGCGSAVYVACGWEKPRLRYVACALCWDTDMYGLGSLGHTRACMV